jgi:nuclease S1
MNAQTTRRLGAAAATLALLLTPRLALAWGDLGHRIVAQIGDDELSPPARDRVHALIGARRLAQIANWPDFIRSEPNWKFVDSWHYFDVDDGEDLSALLAQAEATPQPDNVVEAIGFFAGILRGDAAKAQLFRDLMAQNKVEPLDGSLDATALAFLVHFVGDVHQPLHVGRTGDRGGNSVAVNWFGEVSNLHAVWDEGLISNQHLGYSEYTDFLEREFKGTETKWRGASPADWAKESMSYRSRVYEIWKRTNAANHMPDLGWDYSHDQIGLVEQRLFQGGVRLAELLNSIFAQSKPGG